MNDGIFILNTLVIVGILVSAFLAMRFERLLSSIIAMCVTGAFVSLEFILLQAPDVAIAEAAVGALLSTVLFVITLKKVGDKRDDGRSDKGADDGAEAKEGGGE